MARGSDGVRGPDGVRNSSPSGSTLRLWGLVGLLLVLYVWDSRVEQEIQRWPRETTGAVTGLAILGFLLGFPVIQILFSIVFGMTIHRWVKERSRGVNVDESKK